MDLVIRNGKLVTPPGIIHGWIGVKDGKIRAIGSQAAPPEAREVIDAKDNYVIPGLVDPHAHPAGMFALQDDVKTEPVSAAFGGITTMGALVEVPRMGQPFKEFTEPQDVVSWKEAFPLGKKLVDEYSVMDWFFTFTINSDQHAREIPEYARDLGVTSFKFFGNLKEPVDSPVSPKWKSRIGVPLSYDDSTIFLGFENIGRIGPPARAHVHNENTELTKIFAERLKKEGKRDLAAWADRSPPFLEAEHISRFALYARVTGAPFYVLHLTTAAGLEECNRQRNRGTDIIVETCPQYLTLTKFDDPPGVLAKVNPPIRTREDNERLWEGLAKGEIDCIGTDHVPTTRLEKIGKGDTSDHDTDPARDIWSTGSGFTGFETLLPLMITEGVHKGRISLKRLVEVACENPARASGLYPKKGAIALGADADLVVVDMNKKMKVSYKNFHTCSDFCLWEGWELMGWPILTIVRGTVVVKDGQLVGKPGTGRYLPRRLGHKEYPMEE